MELGAGAGGPVGAEPAGEAGAGALGALTGIRAVRASTGRGSDLCLAARRRSARGARPRPARSRLSRDRADAPIGGAAASGLDGLRCSGVKTTTRATANAPSSPPVVAAPGSDTPRSRSATRRAGAPPEVGSRAANRRAERRVGGRRGIGAPDRARSAKPCWSRRGQAPVRRSWEAALCVSATSNSSALGASHPPLSSRPASSTSDASADEPLLTSSSLWRAKAVQNSCAPSSSVRRTSAKYGSEWSRVIGGEEKMGL